MARATTSPPSSSGCHDEAGGTGQDEGVRALDGPPTDSTGRGPGGPGAGPVRVSGYPGFLKSRDTGLCRAVDAFSAAASSRPRAGTRPARRPRGGTAGAPRSWVVGTAVPVAANEQGGGGARGVRRGSRTCSRVERRGNIIAFCIFPLSDSVTVPSPLSKASGAPDAHTRGRTAGHMGGGVSRADSTRALQMEMHTSSWAPGRAPHAQHCDDGARSRGVRLSPPRSHRPRAARRASLTQARRRRRRRRRHDGPARDGAAARGGAAAARRGVATAERHQRWSSHRRGATAPR